MTQPEIIDAAIKIPAAVYFAGWAAGSGFIVWLVKNVKEMAVGTKEPTERGPRCVMGRTFQSHVTETHDALEGMRRIEPALNRLNDEAKKQTAILERIAKNGKG